jgi:caffeoyl-CoA O-methyltransferase
MANRNEMMPERLYEYLCAVSLREPEPLKRLREETAALPNGGMQVPPEQGQFLGLLVQLLQARKTLEVGVFTGYSSTSVALALPEGGRIVACDVSQEFTDVARRYWKEVGVADKIELRLGPALETLDRLLDEGQENSFDFAFIDADKTNYAAYFERALVLVRQGGLIAIDNVLWHSRVIDPGNKDPDTLAIRAFNEKLLHDSRVSLSLVPIGDGVTLAFKRRQAQK